MASAINYAAFGLLSFGYQPNTTDAVSRSQLVPVRSDGDPAFAVTTELDGIELRLSFRWMPRLERWLCTPQAPDLTPLSLPHLVQAGGEMTMDVRDARVPPGRLRWIGPDSYHPDDIGESLRLVYETQGPERLPPTYSQYAAWLASLS